MLDEAELQEIQMAAHAERVTVAEWVRQSLRRSLREAPGRPVEAKLEAVRKAATFAFPSGDINEMLADIEHGRNAGLPR